MALCFVIFHTYFCLTQILVIDFDFVDLIWHWDFGSQIPECSGSNLRFGVINFGSSLLDFGSLDAAINGAQRCSPTLLLTS